MEDAIETLKLAWTGKPFEYHGRTVQILPRPAQRPRPQIAMGGASPASARRAARIADDYQPLASRLYELYLEELASLGKSPSPESRPPRPAGVKYVFVAEDPDRYWALLAPHAFHDTQEYAGWIGARRGGGFSAVASADELRADGNYWVGTPDECLELASRSGALSFKPLVGGLDPDMAWESLETFAQKVLPRLQA
jgi:alkanesulfonate monooxygenase SsuD/methylene tetrahydromethanopterin reductase-like flavin-dependent oxidoreductase (luciferase family)